MLQKYVALYAAELVKDNKITEALALYVENGAPAQPQNYNLYKRIATHILGMQDTNTAAAYGQWADLRSMLFDLVGIRHRGSILT